MAGLAVLLQDGQHVRVERRRLRRTRGHRSKRRRSAPRRAGPWTSARAANALRAAVRISRYLRCRGYGAEPGPGIGRGRLGITSARPGALGKCASTPEVAGIPHTPGAVLALGLSTPRALRRRPAETDGTHEPRPTPRHHAPRRRADTPRVLLHVREGGYRRSVAGTAQGRPHRGGLGRGCRPANRRRSRGSATWASSAGYDERVEVLGFVDERRSADWIAESGARVMNPPHQGE